MGDAACRDVAVLCRLPCTSTLPSSACCSAATWSRPAIFRPACSSCTRGTTGPYTRVRGGISARLTSRVSRPRVTTRFLGDHRSAKAAGVTLLNEIGLDPGIDHLSAMQLIDHAHATGGRVVSFQSLCGGLPAPEAADNALQYKFSWSPRGVLAAGMNSSRFLKDGKVRLFGQAATREWVHRPLSPLNSPPDFRAGPSCALRNLQPAPLDYRDGARPPL